MIFYLSKWYKMGELNFRISILTGAGFLSGAFGSLLAAGTLQNLEGVRGLSSWYIFLDTGSLFALANRVGPGDGCILSRVR